ncbi:MAG: glycosyltransferase family 39 protein [Acidobacteriota bacterium]
MAEATNTLRDRSGALAIAFAVFAILLLVAFLSDRGSDVEQLPAILGDLGGGPLLGFEGIRDSLVGSIAAGLIGISWFGLGSFVSGYIKVERAVEHSHVLELVTATAIGAAIWSVVWFFLGLVGAYSGIAAIAAVLVGLAMAVMSRRRVREAKAESRVPEKPTGFDRALLLLIAVPLGLAFVASLAPPVAKDTLLYHFAVPKAYIAQHGNAFIDGNIASYLALGTEMHMVWAMLLGGFVSSRAAEIAGGVITFSFLPLLLAALFGWARETGLSRRWSLIAVLLVATVPTAFHVASSGYIDIALALNVTLAIGSLCRWWTDRENGSLIMIAIFLGAALAIKLTALFVVAAFALVIVFRARDGKDSAKVLLTGIAALILAGVIASPWYLRTWQATGSPVFPFYLSIWKGEAAGWDVERSNLFQQMNKAYGGDDKNALEYVLTPWNLSVSAQPEMAEHFDGVLGVAFLFGLPILIWGLWKFELPVEAKIGTAVAAVMFLFWLFSSQQLRYLLPILPVLSLSIAASAEAISPVRSGLRQVWLFGFAAAAIVGILVSAAWFCQKAPIRVALGGETRDQYLMRNLDYYPYYQAINTETPVGSRIWLINMRRDTYNIDRPVVSDYLFEDWTLRKLVWESRSVQELRAKAAAMNVQYVLTRYDFLFDYDRSTLVDDKMPRAENDAKLKIAKDFILDPARTVRADNKFSLIKVF